MKSYVFNDYDEEEFICNYEIKNDNIIVNYASRDKEIIPYTKINEKSVLNRMKNQLKNNILLDEFDKKQKLYLKGCKKNMIRNLSLGSFLTVCIMMGMDVFININILIDIYLYTTGLVYTYGYIDGIDDIKDLEKNKLYIENEEKIKELINSDININNIDEMSLKKIKKYVKKIEKEKYI